jgi:hypothetical protein
LGSFDDFVADVFTFAIAICPDDQEAGILGLGFDVFGDYFFIL